MNHSPCFLNDRLLQLLFAYLKESLSKFLVVVSYDELFIIITIGGVSTASNVSRLAKLRWNFVTLL